jgi:WD40-like Beta Propeller Repeat
LPHSKNACNEAIPYLKCNATIYFFFNYTFFIAMRTHIILIALLATLFATTAQAQYFGRNKPRYNKEDFKVSQTSHFEIYDYLNNPEKRQELADAAELWYRMHQQVLRDTFRTRNPMIIYNDHAGFQQTNAIMGDISVGTGGVTEGLRNRVVFPIAYTNQQTHHVLGHELVHAFQYHLILSNDSMNLQNMGNIPLWMVEGLAEYMSIGRIDPHTALWMRDAVLHNDLPKRLRDLDNGRFFPYRWGQAFWAYVTGVYGDEVIRPLFENAAKFGPEIAIQMTLGLRGDELIGKWADNLRTYYSRVLKIPVPIEGGTVVEQDRRGRKKVELLAGFQEKAYGTPIITDDNAGDMNICPVVSPNGKYVIFLTEKNLFTTDLYLADAKTGKLIRKIVSTAKDGHIDQLNFLESAGTWSPDSKRFAFDAYQEGKSVLIIKNIKKGGKTERRNIPGVPSFSNPTWSPDGKTIVVVGLVKGQVDLYAYEVKSKKVRRLTNDNYAESLPAWSDDGARLVYSTDELSQQKGRTEGAWRMNLAVMEVATGRADMLDLFPNADNMNPNFDKNGNLIFLSNRDGFRNMYRYEFSTQRTYQMTDLLTGITGITPYAPALSVAEDRDRIVYTYLSDGDYLIFQARLEDFLSKPVNGEEPANYVNAALPPFIPGQRDMVNTNLRLKDNNLKAAAGMEEAEPTDYKPKFNLEFLSGGAGAGVLTGNSAFGNNVGVGGGLNMLFRDILGNNQIFGGLSLNGRVQDIAGQASYINQKNRIGWGFNVTHFPFANVAGYNVYNTTIEIQGQQIPVVAEEVLIDRLFNQRVGGLVFYPFSTTRRIELNAAMDFYQQRTTAEITYYDQVTFQAIANDRERGPRGPRFRMGSIGTAYVGDNSFFGFTSPLQGYRYRVGVERFLGFWNFNTALLDGRYYWRLKPFTLAARGMAYARMGGNANNTNEVFPFFIGQPWFVRGYQNAGLYDLDPTLLERVVGSKIGVANFEIRLPFTGPRALALIPTNFLISDLNIFFDAGLATFTWDALREQPPGSTIRRREPVASVGASLRVNLFGALIVEPFFALPLSLDPTIRQWGWGLNIQPGW